MKHLEHYYDSITVREIILRVLVGWFVGFYGISTFVGYLTPNPFLCKQFSLAWVHSLIVKNISISNYSSSYILQFSLV